MLLRTARTQSLLRTSLLWWLICVLAVLALAHIPVRAAESESPGGVKWKVCDHPPLCFASKQARLDWASANHCHFLEDVCEHPPTNDDNKGASEADRGFWGDLWDGVKTGLTYGYEFVKGLVAGLKDQAQGLVDLLRNFDDVLSGLISLGKSFYNDPGGTIKQLAEILGQDAVDTITKATMCGAYDTGKVVGQNINPVVIAKLATKIARYSGDLTRAARATKVELGCASFVAGTPVITPAGSVAIERIVAGQTVMSRSERGFSDAPQQVTKTFSRRVEGYRSVTTEFDTLNVTEEHPFWLQGKGWTPVKELKRGDVVATAGGDALVLTNEWVTKRAQVYNFAVDKTESYFVGSGTWVHNAKCDLPDRLYRAPPSPSNYKIGASDGGPGAWIEINRRDSVSFRYEKEVTGAPPNVEYRVGNANFDGYDASRDVLIDAKNYQNVLSKDKPFQMIVDKELDQARRQIEGAGRTPIEWHVATKGEADALRALFANPPDIGTRGPINITVIWTQRITE